MRYPTRRKKFALILMLMAICLTIVGIGIEMSSHGHSARVSRVGIGAAALGVAGGVTAYVVNRWD